MSCWGTVDVELRFAEPIDDAILESMERQMPTGSESGPSFCIVDHRLVYAEGRMRDVTDLDTSAEMLAWFISCCRGYPETVTAQIEWDFDGGPRYRYTWANGTLTKLRGVLD